MATHSSVLAWRIPGTGEPRGLPSMGSHRVGHDWSDLAAAVHILIFILFNIYLSFHKCMQSYHYQYNQDTEWFHHPTIPYTAHVLILPPSSTPSNHCVLYSYSFNFSIKSEKWNQTICSLFSLAFFPPFSINHFLEIYLCCCVYQ